MVQVVDFQWHAGDPYTMVSVSDSGEGGTLQVWRISDMIWRPIDEVLAELEQHRCLSQDSLLSCQQTRRCPTKANSCDVHSKILFSRAVSSE